MSELEIEVKFFPKDIRAVQKRISAIGAKSSGRVFETNVVYDDKAGSLRRRKALLRLRRDRNTTLTFKIPPPNSDGGDCKILTELEVQVGEFDTMDRILAAVGYHRQFVYEKWRETFVVHQSHICLDTLPYGDFVEVEGPKEEIRSLAERIGLDWENRIVLNYHDIFTIIRQRLHLPFRDIRFDAFKGIAVDFHQFHPLFRTPPRGGESAPS